MAMTLERWGAHKRNREQWGKDFGQWIGIADENLEPLFHCPLPVSFNAPRTRGAPVSGSALFPVLDDSGVVHDLADELISDAWGAVDNQGELVPHAGPTRYLIVERPNTRRRAFQITHSKLSGEGPLPSLIEVHGEGLLSKLNRTPLFSGPTTISGEFTRFTRDWVGEETEGTVFKRPRDLQDIQMATVADGSTLTGPAEQVIRRAIEIGVEAKFRAIGKPQTILVSTVGSGLESPPLAFTMSDGYLWDSLGALALQAGVVVDVFVWWPGDPQVPGVPTLTEQRIIVTVEQGSEVDTNG